MSNLQPQIQSALEPTYRVDRELDGGGMARVFLAARCGAQLLAAESRFSGRQH
jgi:hypothetical protein